MMKTLYIVLVQIGLINRVMADYPAAVKSFERATEICELMVKLNEGEQAYRYLCNTWYYRATTSSTTADE